ncbi:hypothetical protein BGX34_004324 [Mortierella sp. NVP85]|nr:hypothetical protein BGX34_004324 [Mortierella sp. NVP85]
MKLNEKSVKALENLRNYPRQVDSYLAPRRSAVLVALLANSEGDLEVILTVRSSKLRTNAGDSAFPGGKQDPEDVDLIATAKREAMEEVRLPPSETEVLTILAPVLSRHLLVVTPVVVFCPNMTTSDLPSLYPNPGEVAAIFTAPLEYFLNPRPGDHACFDMSWLHSEHRMHRFERCGSHNYVLGESNDASEKTIGTIETTATTATATITNNQTEIGWPVYGMTAGLSIEVARIAYQREPDYELYAPGQLIDTKQMATLYNKEFAIRSSL